jgi:hypothetical protein
MINLACLAGFFFAVQLSSMVAACFFSSLVDVARTAVLDCACHVAVIFG